MTSNWFIGKRRYGETEAVHVRGIAITHYQDAVALVNKFNDKQDFFTYWAAPYIPIEEIHERITAHRGGFCTKDVEAEYRNALGVNVFQLRH